jgi:hypothetical protein
MTKTQAQLVETREAVRHVCRRPELNRMVGVASLTSNMGPGRWCSIPYAVDLHV